MFSTAAEILCSSALKVSNHAARYFHFATVQHDTPQHAPAPAGADPPWTYPGRAGRERIKSPVARPDGPQSGCDGPARWSRNPIGIISSFPPWPVFNKIKNEKLSTCDHLSQHTVNIGITGAAHDTSRPGDVVFRWSLGRGCRRARCPLVAAGWLLAPSLTPLNCLQFDQDASGQSRGSSLE